MFLIGVAHVIRQASTMLARAIFALNASCRWAVTGTPIQNRLTDLASLFKFLRVHPFDDQESFRHHFLRSWKTRSDPQAVIKLKLLIKSITIRRPKREVSLPGRTDTIHPLQMHLEERTHYDNIRDNTLHEIDAVMNATQCEGSLNALQLITRLRLICNHGVNEMAQESANIKTGLPWGVQLAQDTFESLRDTGQAYCLCCRQDLSFVMTDGSDCGDATTLQPQVSKDLRVLCASCFEQRPQYGQAFLRVCNHLPRCSSSQTLGIRTPTSLCESQSSSNCELSETVSTKIEALIASLSGNQQAEKRLVLQDPDPLLID